MLSLLFNADQVNRIIQSSFLIEKSTGDFQTVEGGMIALEPKTGTCSGDVPPGRGASSG